MTNGDRIRAMTDEELAEYLCSFSFEQTCPPPYDTPCVFDSCEPCWSNWLKQEATE